MKKNIYTTLFFLMSISSLLFSQNNKNSYTKLMLGKEKIENWVLNSPNIWKVSLECKPLYVLSNEEYLFNKYVGFHDWYDSNWFWRNDTLYLMSIRNPDSNSMNINVVKESSGWSVTSGDFNGDRIQDIVTIPYFPDSCCHIFYGDSNFNSLPDYTLKADERIFWASSAGDINGDGYDELMLATAWGVNKVYIYLGSAKGIDSSFKIELSDSNYGFGHLISKHPGDINNDGYDDVLISGLNPPHFNLYYGKAGGIKKTPDCVIELTSSHVSSVLLSFIGDINNDSFQDIAVSTGSSSSNNTSRVNIYYGSSIGLDTTKSQLLDVDIGEVRTHYSTLSVSKANDVNNDGIDDLILGDQFANGLYDHEGKIFIFYGSKDSLNNIPDKKINNPHPEFNVRFGSDLDGVGDVNNDGINDIVVGSPYANKAFIFYGSLNGLSDSNYTTLTNSQHKYFGWSISNVGNIFDDHRNYFIVGEEMGISFLFTLAGQLPPIIDTIAPSITLIGSSDTTIGVNTSFNDPGVSVHDNYTPANEITINKFGFIDTSKIGIYHIYYSATDSAGNSSDTVTRTVHVVDTKAPSISLIGSSDTTIGVNTSYNDPGVTVFDNYTPINEITINKFGFIDTSKIGIYHLNYSASDSVGNNSDTVTRTVHVVDTIGSIFPKDTINYKVYPNPSDGIFILKIDLPEKQEISIAIYNTLGRKIFTKENIEVFNGQYKIDINEYNEGIYLLMIKSQEKQTLIRLFKN